MFQLTKEEWASLRCQIGISNAGRGGRRYRPRVFSEQGIAMLSSVLRSKQAVAVNIFKLLREVTLTKPRRKPIGFVPPQPNDGR